MKPRLKKRMSFQSTLPSDSIFDRFFVLLCSLCSGDFRSAVHQKHPIPLFSEMGSSQINRSSSVQSSQEHCDGGFHRLFRIRTIRETDSTPMVIVLAGGLGSPTVRNEVL